MNLRSAIVLIAACGLLPLSAHAQSKPDTASIWTLQEENASFSGNRPADRLYVNGLRLSWASPTGDVPHFLTNLGNKLWGSGEQRIELGLSQQMYNPVNTYLTVADPHDRPYAGVLLGNATLLSDTEDTRSVLTLSVGVVGPASGAEQLQKGWHDLIGEGSPNGWNSQIQNVPAIELLHERTWRLPITTVAGMETDALPSLSVGIGDLRDYVQTGITFRIGQGLNSDFGVPRVRPGLSGGDVFVPTRPFAWYVFAGADGQAVAYDMLLQAAPFRGGPHVSARWAVAELQGGFAVMAYGMRLTFAYVAQTPEFNGQGGGMHEFGSASLAMRF